MQAYLDREARASLHTLLARCQPAEVAYVLGELRAGRVDGHDDRFCLIGHIATYRRSNYVACGLSRADTWPIESWLWDVGPGDTPENHAQARLLEAWLVEWLDARTLEPVERRVGVRL